jgi:hypothetical protein
MNARDLPGYGDPATFSVTALASLRLLDQMHADDHATDVDIAEAVQEAKDWMDTYFSAMNAGNVERARMARSKALEIMQSLEVVRA